MKLKVKILMFTICPIILLALIFIGIILGPVNQQMQSEIEDSLKSTACAALAAYMQNSGDYFQSPNGEIWKGGYNISHSTELVDKIKEVTNTEVTFFYGKKRIMTSAKDEDGNRVLGNDAGDVVVKSVLEKGENYFSNNISLGGREYYGYYIPVIENGKVIGMVFAGSDKAEKDARSQELLRLL